MHDSATVLDHPTIGTILGVRNSRKTVNQYLGIQYADLVDGFAPATLRTTYQVPIEASAQGPLPIGNPQACDNEHLLLQHSLPHPEYKFSDTECLTLNVITPTALTPGQGAPLPVVVFVHGGGFVTGSANWPQWDLCGLVERSIEAGKPVVAVGISYRIGIFGFMNSEAMRESGYLPNNGLHDQKLALRWVQKYINGFGGDPKRVTFLGSSIAGGAGFTHLQSEEPLFSRLAAIGGSGLIQPLPPVVAEMAYGITVKHLGLDSLTSAEQVTKLVQEVAKQDELRVKAASVPAPINAVLDGDVVKDMATYSKLGSADTVQQLWPGTRWCDAILVSDSRLDGMVFSVTALAGRTDNLHESLEKALRASLGQDSPVVPAVLSAYGINKSTPDDITPVIHFLNDIGFRIPARTTAEAWAATGKGTSYLAHFDAPNPWPGQWQGYASHALDLAFLLQNYNEFLAPGQRAVADKMAQDVIAFTYGEAPFAAFGEKGTARTYYAGMDDQEASVTEAAHGERRVPVVALEEIVGGKREVLDQLLGSLGNFFQGP